MGCSFLQKVIEGIASSTVTYPNSLERTTDKINHHTINLEELASLPIYETFNSQLFTGRGLYLPLVFFLENRTPAAYLFEPEHCFIGQQKQMVLVNQAQSHNGIPQVRTCLCIPVFTTSE